jgi:hypothetical protein
MPNGSGNDSLFIGRSSMSHNERQNRVLILGGTMWILSFVVGGVAHFATNNGQMHLTLFGLLLMVDALLQTIGAMVVAATDADPLTDFETMRPNRVSGGGHGAVGKLRRRGASVPWPIPVQLRSGEGSESRERLTAG